MWHADLAAEAAALLAGPGTAAGLIVEERRWTARIVRLADCPACRRSVLAPLHHLVDLAWYDNHPGLGWLPAALACGVLSVRQMALACAQLALTESRRSGATAPACPHCGGTGWTLRCSPHPSLRARSAPIDLGQHGAASRDAALAVLGQRLPVVSFHGAVLFLDVARPDGFARMAVPRGPGGA